MVNPEIVSLRNHSLDDGHDYDSNEEGRLSNVDIQDPPRCHKHTKGCKNLIRYIALILLIIILIIIALFLCFLEGVSGVYLFDNLDERNRTSYYYPEPQELTARAWPHSTYRPMDCRDFYDPIHGDFGCCAIYDYRGLYNISWNRITKDDMDGKNCPTYKHLIKNYIEYINKYSTPLNCTEEDCCIMNYAIDRSIRENATFPINRNDPQYNIEIPVSNDYYDCRPRNIISAYENHYEGSSSILLCILLIIVLLAVSLQCIKERG